MISPGQKYGYRERPRAVGESLQQVEIVRLSPRDLRPKQARIRYLEGEYEGLEAWVPQARLVIPWEKAAAFSLDERRVLAAKEASGDVYETIPWKAVDSVLGSLPMPLSNQVLVGVKASERELLEVRELEDTSARLHLSSAELLSEPFAFVDRFGTFKAPFTTALRVAKHCCEHFPEQVLSSVSMEEQALRNAVMTGHYVWQGSIYIEYQISREEAERRLREEEPVYALVRSWCGQQALEAMGEVAEGRKELGRLRALIQSAAQWMKETGQPEMGQALLDDMNQVPRRKPGRGKTCGP